MSNHLHDLKDAALDAGAFTGAGRPHRTAASLLWENFHRRPLTIDADPVADLAELQKAHAHSTTRMKEEQAVNPPAAVLNIEVPAIVVMEVSL